MGTQNKQTDYKPHKNLGWVWRTSDWIVYAVLASPSSCFSLMLLLPPSSTHVI